MSLTLPAKRTGATLAELMVALVITGVAGLIGVGLMAAAERRARADAIADRGAQLARDVAHVLGPEIAAADPARVAILGDTALDLTSHVGVGVVCVATPGILVLPGDTASAGAPYTAWRSVPERGDVVLVWDTLAIRWQPGVVDSVSRPVDGGGCSSQGPFRSLADSLSRTPVTRLRLAAPLTGSIGAGAPVRVYRDVRWVLYRSADRRWWMGMRRCAGGVCGATQPVAGPLAAPSDSGLRFRVERPGTVQVTTRAATDPPSRWRVVTQLWAVRGAPDTDA